MPRFRSGPPLASSLGLSHNEAMRQPRHNAHIAAYLEAKPTSVSQAARQARHWPHGSALYVEALTFLTKAQRAADGGEADRLSGLRRLEALWAWVGSQGL